VIETSDVQLHGVDDVEALLAALAARIADNREQTTEHK
jgi:hypothetical protein